MFPIVRTQSLRSALKTVRHFQKGSAAAYRLHAPTDSGRWLLPAAQHRTILSQRSMSMVAEASAEPEKSEDVQAEQVGKGPFNVFEAVGHQLNEKQPNFVQTIDLCIMTGLDPRKPDQSIRTTVNLPNNLGKVVRVAVFAKGPAAEAASAAGADIVGDSELIEKIKDGFLEFDRCIAIPSMMPELAKIGKILGPRGLMPNPKTNTVTQDVAAAIESAKAGAIEIKTDRLGAVRCGVARVGFSEQQILDNIKAVMLAMQQNKPSGSKGKYITKVYLSSTMGRSYNLDTKSVDAGSAQFFRPPRRETA